VKEFSGGGGENRLMSSLTFEGVRISGIACAVPDNKVHTDYFKKYFEEKEIEQFIKTSGVKFRYFSHEKQTASDLCYAAAKKLMEHKGYTGDDIDAVIFMTQTPDYIIPATSFVIHKRLKIKEDCIVYDINLGCSAFPTGVCNIASMIKSGIIKRALLLIGDCHDHNYYFEDKVKHDSMLVGDACSACIIEEGSSTINISIKSDGGGFDAIMILGPTISGRFRLTDDLQKNCDNFVDYMNGSDVFLFTITKVPKLFKEFYKEFNCSPNDFDYFIFHQANKMILDHIEKKLKLPKEKVPRSIENFGNTDGASVLMTIADLCERENVPDKIKFITSAFGTGLNWGMASFEIDKKDILPIVYTNDYFEDGYVKHILEEIEKR